MLLRIDSAFLSISFKDEEGMPPYEYIPESLSEPPSGEVDTDLGSQRDGLSHDALSLELQESSQKTIGRKRERESSGSTVVDNDVEDDALQPVNPESSFVANECLGISGNEAKTPSRETVLRCDTENRSSGSKSRQSSQEINMC